MRRGLLLSFLFHLSLFATFHFFSPSRDVLDPNPAQVVGSPSATLDLVSWQKSKAKIPAKAFRARRSSLKQKEDSGHRLPGTHLQGFNPNSIETLSQLKGFAAYNHGDGDLSQSDNPSAPWGEGGQEFARIADTHLMSLSSERLGGLIQYPGQFRTRKISGVIRARLVTQASGDCQWSDSYVRGNNPYLRFYVLTVLKQFCRHDAWREMAKRPSANLDFAFDFNLHSKKPFSIKVNGNLFLVHIPGDLPEGTWFWGPLTGNFLIPNFVALNPQWIVENWNQLVHDEDPLARFREPE